MESVGMLSRIALKSVPRASLARGLQTNSGPALSAAAASQSAEGAERDLKNFPRPVRPINPGKVRMGFIPEEWFDFFYKKTGVTGPYMFGVGLTTYLVSKEVYVMEHEFYSGLSLAIMAIVAVKKLGPAVAAYADKEVDNIENSWKESREIQVRSLEEAVAAEKKEQWRTEGQTMLFAAKKENVALQLEAAYRERVMNAFSEVKKRLDYQVETQNIERRISQKNMTNWVVNNVLKSISPQQEQESLKKCIADLKGLAATA